MGAEPSVLWRQPYNQPKSIHSGDRFSTDFIPWNARYSFESGNAKITGTGGAHRADQRSRINHRGKWLRQRTYRSRSTSLFASLLETLGGCKLRRPARKSG